MSEPTTQAGRALLRHADHCPSDLPEQFAEAVAAIEAEARAEAVATIAALRSALDDLLTVTYEDDRLKVVAGRERAHRVLADTAAATRNYLDLASPEAERRIAEAMHDRNETCWYVDVGDGEGYRECYVALHTSQARAFLAALRAG